MSGVLSVRLAHLSDPHFGTTDPRVRDALLGELRMHPPDVIVLSGDITQRARPCEFVEARRFIDALPRVPLLCIPGNHDLPLFDLLTRLVNPYGRYRRHIAMELAPRLLDERIGVLCVDATRRFRHKDGMLSPSQIARTANDLAALRTPFRVVVTHQPLATRVASERHNLAQGASQALDQWIAAGADLLLGGHIHLPYCIEVTTADRRHSAVLLQAGTCVSTRVRNGIPNSFNLVTLERSGNARRLGIERRDYDAASGRFVTARQHEALSLMDRRRTRLNGWQLLSRNAA